jgi:hypothetical protein
MLVSVLLESTWEPCMMSVNLLLLLSSSHVRFSHVDDDAFVSVMVVEGGVSWLVLSSDGLGDYDCHSSDWHPCGVE